MRKLITDPVIALISTIIMNIPVIYVFLKHGEPLYFHYDEIIWVKQLDFCGGRFAFYEQSWGLVIPLLCIIYPIKIIMNPYYFSLIRIPLTFLNCLLTLKLLNLIFKNKTTSLIIFFFHFSNLFSIIRFFTSYLDETSMISNIYGNSIRIFNPSFFEPFFLGFCISFIKTLSEQKHIYLKPSSRNGITAGIMLGLLAYSTVYWWIYPLISSLILFLFGFLKKERQKEIFQVLILAFIISLPAIIFNYFQYNLLGEGLKRGAMTLKFERSFPDIPKEFITLLFLSFISFLFHGDFSLKYLFIISSVISGFSLLFTEAITGIYSQITTHITVQFKLSSKIAIGLILDKKFSKVLKRIASIIMFLIFSINWGIFFHSLKDFSPNKNFAEISKWLRTHTDKDSVIIVEDAYGFFPLFDLFPTSSELLVSVASKRYVFHNNINYFSDLSDKEVFERFILRAMILGYTLEDLEEYIKDISKINHVVWSGWPSLWVSRAYFGVPENFDILIYKDIQSAIPDLLNVIKVKYSDKDYMQNIMRKYKIDFVIRKRPKLESESYLKEVEKINGFFIFQIIQK